MNCPREASRASRHIAVAAVAFIGICIGSATSSEAGTTQLRSLDESSSLTEDPARTAEVRAEAARELIVVMEPNHETGGPGSNNLSASLKQLGGKIVEGGADDIKTVRFPDTGISAEILQQKADKVSGLPRVDYAEPNGFVAVNYSPNDQFFSHSQGASNQGYLRLVGLQNAWTVNKGRGVAIGFVDTGVYKHLRDLSQGKVIAERDVVNNDSSAEDTTGHGTTVSSVAAAVTDNGYAMAGAGFDARIAACRANRRGVNGYTFANEARCIDWLQKLSKVKVINISSGTDRGYSKTVAHEIAETQSRYGKVVVAAAGNYPGTNSTSYTRMQFPASLPGVIGVGSIDSATRRSAFSVRGPHVDLMAPGHGVIAALRNSSFGAVSGTSYSASIVSGCAALMYADGFNLTQVRSSLFNTAHDMSKKGRDDSTGYGYLDCGAAIRTR